MEAWKNNFEIRGIIVRIFDTTEIKLRDGRIMFQRNFVIKTDEQYPQLIQFSVKDSNCQVLDFYKIDNEVDVWFNIRGIEYVNSTTAETRYFSTFMCWKIKKVMDSPHVQHNYNFPDAKDVFGPDDNEDDGLPF